MFKQIIAATIAATVSFTVPQTVHAQDQKKWYAARFKAESCVSLGNIGKGPNERLHFESGPFKTPEDFAAWYISAGAHYERADDEVPNGMEGWVEVWHDFDTDDGRMTSFIFFSDKRLCDRFMSKFER